MGVSLFLQSLMEKRHEKHALLVRIVKHDNSDTALHMSRPQPDNGSCVCVLLRIWGNQWSRAAGSAGHVQSRRGV